MDTNAPAPDSPTAAPRPGRILRRLAWVGLALVVAVAGGSFALSRFMDPARLASWLEPRLESAVNRDVTVGAVEVGILPLAVRLRDVSVSDPTGLAPRLAFLERLDLRVRLLPLLRREVRVREIRLSGLEADLRVGPDGASNFGDMSPEVGDETGPLTEAGADRPFALQLDGIKLSGGRVSYASAPDSLSLALADLQAEASVRHETASPWIVDGSYRGVLTLSAAVAQGADLSEFQGVPVELTTALEADDDFGGVRIREGTLALDRIRLGVSGEASRLKDPVRHVDLAIEASGIAMEDVLALVPDDVREARDLRAGGFVSAGLSVRGALGLDSLPSVAGSVAVSQGALSMGAMPLLDALEATAELPGDGSLRPSAQGRLLSGEFQLGGVLRMEEGAPYADLNLAMDPDLGAVDGGLLPEGMGLRGRVPSSLRVVGDPTDPRSLGLWGDVGLRDVRATHPGLGVPVVVAAAALSLQGSQASLAPTDVWLGDDRVTLEGTLLDLTAGLAGGVPEFRGSALGSRVSLLALSPDPVTDTTLTWGRIAFAKVGNRPVHGVSADEAARQMGLSRPASLPLAGEIQVALDTVIDLKGRMEDVEATLVFGPDFLQVTRSSFRRYGGRIEAVAALELGSQQEEPFTLKLTAQGVDAGAFLGETTSLGRAVTGTLDLDVDLVGALDGLLLPSRQTLQGTGSFSLTGGGLQPGALGQRLAGFLGVEALASPRVRDWSTGFVLRDGRVLLQEATVEGAPGSPRVGGGVGLDGGLDLVTAFDLPRDQLAGEALQRLGVPQTPGALDVVAAVLRVGGTLTDPEVRADPRATVTAVTDVVEDQARAELDRQIQERQTELRERATGFLRGLLGQRDTTRTPPPPDTVRVDTLGAGTPTADTLGADTLKPDTVRPDTTVLCSASMAVPPAAR